MTQDLEYYQRREQQERIRASSCADTIAKRLHLEMAERYSAIVRDNAGAAQGVRA